MLFAIQSWHRRWEKSKPQAARDEEKEANQELDLLEKEGRYVRALNELKGMEQELKAKLDRLKHLNQPTDAKEKHKLEVELEHFKHDILINQTALQDLVNEIAEHFEAAAKRRSNPRRVEGIVRTLAGEGVAHMVPSRSSSTRSARSSGARPHSAR